MLPRQHTDTVCSLQMLWIECPNWLLRLAIKSTSGKSGTKPDIGSTANVGRLHVLWFAPPVRFTRIISRNLSQDRQAVVCCTPVWKYGLIFPPCQGEVLWLIPVLWAERWSPPPVWSPCWTCPATACPLPAAWSKRHCWPGSDNCLHCWGAEKHLPLNGQEQQQRKHHCFVTHSKIPSSFANRRFLGNN